jgi:DNA-binding transcriptional LysR family regulator
MESMRLAHVRNMSIRLNRLPSLDLLKSFVAVGSQMSITRAADQLCLTQSAVSRQVQALEAAIGCPLLLRGHRSLRFTAEGERLYRESERLLAQFQILLDDLVPLDRPVSVNASIGVTALWLLPRLAQFQVLQPQIEVRVTALNRVIDLSREAMDLTIRYCPVSAAPAGAVRLFGEQIIPVTRPGMGFDRIDSPAKLSELVLIEYDELYVGLLRWHHWLAAQGWQDIRPRATLRFNQYDQAILAAMAGQGVALGRLPLLTRQFADGLLAMVPGPNDGPACEHAYWLIMGGAAVRPEVRTVADWIVAEARSAADWEADWVRRKA